ncbi:MAG: UbiX family flavin prenyltransferase [Bacteroidales bacterium]|nr:UbiX family flavin prenyltransferase [Bacteroidales bacterium]
MNIIIAITGASGMIYAQRLLSKLKEEKIVNQLSDIALILSENVQGIWDNEISSGKISDFSFPIFNNNDFYVPFASGSSAYDAMIIIPCSMGTMGRIASGVSENLIGRAADVMLKERKKLILVTREMPLNLIHINNMKTITEAGGIICPASPTFYNKAQTITDLASTVVERVLDLAGLVYDAKRWK